MDMTSYYQEHADLAAIVAKLRGHLAKPDVGAAAAVIAADLLQLSSKLSVHLGKEDLHLYPKLIGTAGPAKAMAQSFQREMGGLKDVYAAFKKRWATEAKIGADPAGFATDAKAVIHALESRIRRENTELYRAAEKV